MVRSIRVIGEFINGDDDVVFWGRRSYIVLAQTIFMSISFIDILRITLAANTSDIIRSKDHQINDLFYCLFNLTSIEFIKNLTFFLKEKTLVSLRSLFDIM